MADRISTEAMAQTAGGGLCLALLTALVVAGCAGQVGREPVDPWDPEQDAPPAVEPAGLAELPDPEVRWEPLSRSGNRSPYEVFGETYHLLPTAEGYSATGVASWYGRKFHGRYTASGEPYDMFELTAAHRELPLPAYVRVTNLGNQRSTIVKVNDRGPFHEDRIIDLSYAAAVKLGFANDGVASVRIEVITPEERALPSLGIGAAGEGTLDASAGAIWLQAGAFGSAESAQALRTRLEQAIGERLDDVRVQVAEGADKLLRVWIGPMTDLDEAGRLQALVASANAGSVPMIVRDWSY